MPIIDSTYKPLFLFKKKHFNTIFRTFFTYNKIEYIRERLELDDGDFMDLDFSNVNSDTIVIALHGLEGSSNSKYILALAKFFNQDKKDFVAVNHRGCSGEPNRLLLSYHSGKTDDLGRIINHIDKNYPHKNILLVGYSLGGNVVLKYLGEQGQNINQKIKCAVTISAPCDLTSSSVELAGPQNKLYMYKFMKTLKSKTLHKLEQYPGSFLEKKAIKTAKSFYEYDNLYTAPAHGFENAEDYWTKSSSKPFLKSIKIPTLILNSLDDTFLSDECYPYEIAEKHSLLFLETPKYGGHVGFNTQLFGKNGYWLEKRIVAFMKDNL